MARAQILSFGVAESDDDPSRGVTGRQTIGRHVEKLSAISYQTSAISRQPSDVSYQLSAISYQLSAISYQQKARNKKGRPVDEPAPLSS
jgi:hypothetical protein